MKPYTASLINAITLIVLGTWGYFGSEDPSATALIPVVFGALLLLMNKGIYNEHKMISHVAVILTLLVFIGLFKPLLGAIDRANTMAIARVVIMMLSTVLALVFFVKSFVDARKSKVEN